MDNYVDAMICLARQLSQDYPITMRDAYSNYKRLDDVLRSVLERAASEGIDASIAMRVWLNALGRDYVTELKAQNELLKETNERLRKQLRRYVGEKLWNWLENDEQ